MTLSNPNSQCFDETDNRNINASRLNINNRQVVEQKTKISNENLNTQLTISSGSSTASSTSSPPAFSQVSGNTTSTPSSLASSASPQQISNQATPTHPQLNNVDRFRIKKCFQNDILINPSLASTPNNEELRPLKEDQSSENLSLNDLNEKSQTGILNTEQTVKNNERRISIFTVKKVDSSDLLINRRNENVIEDSKSKIDDSLLMQSKQIDKLNEQTNSESVTRTNSLVEKSK